MALKPFMLRAMSASKRRFPQGRGVGCRYFWGKKREKGVGLRALEIGWWTYRPRICDCFYCARGKGNHLQAPAVRPNARYSLAWGSWFPRFPKARDLGHPSFIAHGDLRHLPGGLVLSHSTQVDETSGLSIVLGAFPCGSSDLRSRETKQTRTVRLRPATRRSWPQSAKQESNGNRRLSPARGEDRRHKNTWRSAAPVGRSIPP